MHSWLCIMTDSKGTKVLLNTSQVGKWLFLNNKKIGQIGNLSTVPFSGSFCSCIEKLSVFCNSRSIFSSVFFVGSVLNLVNWLVSNISQHCSKYIFLSISTTPYPLHCFMITILLFFNNLLPICLYLLGTMIFE